MSQPTIKRKACRLLQVALVSYETRLVAYAVFKKFSKYIFYFDNKNKKVGGTDEEGNKK